MNVGFNSTANYGVGNAGKQQVGFGVKLNAKTFFGNKKKSLEDISKWTQEQVKLFGSKEADVPEFKPNEFKITEATRKMFSSKKI